jgi:hypothetical protein
MNKFCVPFAFAFITGKTPDEIADLISEERGDGRPVRGVSMLHWLPVLKVALGVTITATVRRPGMTIRKWAANRAKWGDKSTWIVTNNGHMMVYRDGVIYDNHSPAGSPVSIHEYGTTRLRDALQVSL